jgi:galactonate dehydratase
VKVTDIKSYLVQPREFNRWLFVVVETDEGVTGIGECTNQTSMAHLTRGLEVIKPFVIGRDPANIEAIWQRVYHFYGELNPRGYITHLLSAIDLALWDIKGKVLGVPIYELLGGPVRDRVALYTHVPGRWFTDVPISEMQRVAKAHRAAGFEAIKTDPFPAENMPDGELNGPLMVERLTHRNRELAVEWMQALREAVGPDYELLIDAHARFDTTSAIEGANAMKEIDLIWFEEPTHLESNQALKQIRENTDTPLCVGEHHFTRWDYVPVLEDRLVDYIMPDVAWCGGISEFRRIAALAEPHYIRVSPHDAIGPVAIAAAFQCSMTVPNFYRQECVSAWFDVFPQFIEPMFDVRGGCIYPNGRPGLGIELNMDGVMSHLIDPDDHSKAPPRLRPGLGEAMEGLQANARPRRASTARQARRTKGRN